MKILFSAAFATIFICCANNKKDSEMGSINTAFTNYDSSLHPLLETGAYYIYEINKDTMIGLLVATINKEEDSVYYSFMVSGKYFKVAPAEKEFQMAGLHGSLVPSYGAIFQKSFAKYFVSETHLKPVIGKFKKIGRINLSKKNYYGITAPFEQIEDLPRRIRLAELPNPETDKINEMAGIPSPKHAIIEWKDILMTNNPDEMVRPEVVWILSAKTAHPKSAALMKEEWWWSTVDDLSPFGNDDGSDAFYIFKDWRENHQKADPIVFIDVLEKRWEMSFDHLDNDSEKDLPAIEKVNTFYRNMDRAVIGIALGQIVLEGKISPKLKEIGLKAIKRTKTEFGMTGMTQENKTEYIARLDKLAEVLNKF
jgi:uncharacterized protein YfeS